MARIALKRVLWLGLASILGGTAIHLVLWCPGPTSSRFSPCTYTAALRAMLSSNRSHSDASGTTPNKGRNIRFHRKANTTAKPTSRQSSASLSDAVTANTSRQSTMDKMVAAAATFKAVFVPPTFKFSNGDVYFHPPHTGRARDFSPFLVNPVDTCSGSAESSGGGPFLMVLALSSYLTQAAKEREAIRKTYGSVTKGKRWPGGKPLASPVRMVFVLGRPPTQRHRRALEKESAQYGDLLLADFVDSYQNLTLKVLHGLHWVLQHCPQAKFVLKADDDVFVNLPLLTVFLAGRGSNNSIYGHAYFHGAVRRGGRWAVTRKTYPYPLYPVYMSGTSYVLSTDAAQKIVQASHRVPLIPIEDAFVTGVLAQITAVRRMSCTGFTSYAEQPPHECEFVNDKRFVGNGMTADRKTGLWLTLNTDRLVENCGV